MTTTTASKIRRHARGAVTVEHETLPRIEVITQHGRLDDLVHLGVTGLRPMQVVTLEATAEDDAHRMWQSCATVTADEYGVVDLSSTAPDEGTYTVPDASGLFWSMMLQSDPGPISPSFYKDSLKPYQVSLRLLAQGAVLGERTLTLDLVSPSTAVTEITRPFVGKYFRPRGESSFPAAIVLGDTDGGLLWSEHIAALLAWHGYAALAVAYVDPQGRHGLPTTVTEVPLEFGEDALEWLKERPEVQHGAIAVIGLGKGAELALLLSSRYNHAIRATVAYAPSSHVFEGIAPGARHARSSWLQNGEPIRFVPYPPDVQFTRDMAPASLRPVHERALAEADPMTLEAARIPVERIHGSLLLISGEQDPYWPSPPMASSMVAALSGFGLHRDIEHLTFPEAGHTFSLPNLPPVLDSPHVTLHGAASANREAWEGVTTFLDHHVRTREEYMPDILSP